MIAALTAAPTSPGTVAWNVPRPRAGIEAPVLSATRRRLAIDNGRFRRFRGFFCALI